MMEEDQSQWFEKHVVPLERAYLKGETPWQRSGVGLHTARTYEYWKAVRMPIAECIDHAGSVLDIGCANGYLLECLVEWLRERNIAIEPFGLDISEELLCQAKERLPRSSFYHANVWGWKAPRQFDYVITELVYVPEEYQQSYLEALLRDVVAPQGKLIVTQYSSDTSREISLSDRIGRYGLKISESHSGSWAGVTKTVVAVVPAWDRARLDPDALGDP